MCSKLSSCGCWVFHRGTRWASVRVNSPIGRDAGTRNTGVRGSSPAAPKAWKCSGIKSIWAARNFPRSACLRNFAPQRLMTRCSWPSAPALNAKLMPTNAGSKAGLTNISFWRCTVPQWLNISSPTRRHVFALGRSRTTYGPAALRPRLHRPGRCPISQSCGASCVTALRFPAELEVMESGMLRAEVIVALRSSA